MGSRRADREWPRPRTTRHVWIRSENRLDPPTQGFVLESRRHSYKWFALVQYVQQEKDGPTVYAQQWFRAERLWPVKSDPNGPSGLTRYH
jgi:hypothetical protein